MLSTTTRGEPPTPLPGPQRFGRTPLESVTLLTGSTHCITVAETTTPQPDMTHCSRIMAAVTTPRPDRVRSIATTVETATAPRDGIAYFKTLAGRATLPRGPMRCL